MKRKLIICILFVLLLTGCWDRKELTNIAIVGAIALDQDPSSGQIVMTDEVIRPSTLKTEGGTMQQPPVELVSTKGRTLFEASKNLTTKLDRTPFYTQTKVIVIGETLARNGGLVKVLDRLARSQQISSWSYLVVAKGSKASEILQVDKGLETVQANYLQLILQNKKQNSTGSNPTLLNFMEANAGQQTCSPIAGAVEIENEPDLNQDAQNSQGGGQTGEKNTHFTVGESAQGIKLYGTAVFKEEKLVGFLDNSETAALNWVTGKFQAGSVTAQSPYQKDSLITLELKRTTAQIQTVKEHGNYIFTVRINGIGELVEQQEDIDVSDPSVITQYQKAADNAVKTQIEKAISKLQKQYDADPLGFCAALHRQYPREWDAVERRWPEVFPHVRYAVNVQIKIKNTQLLEKSLHPAN